MRNLGLCEEEYASFAKETLFKRECRWVKVLEDRQWRAERMLQLVTTPNENQHWRVPPVLDDEKARPPAGPVVNWRFDVRPDYSS